MDRVFDILNSPAFHRAMYGLASASLVLALGIIVVAFVFYGRTREAEGLSFEQSKWVMLFAAWRDSLIITLLYVSDGLLFRYADFIGLSQINQQTLYTTPYIVQPIVSLCLHILIFTIAVMRIIALSRWISVHRPD